MSDRTEAQRRRAELGAAVMTLLEKARRENGAKGEDPQLTLAASMVIAELWHQLANVDRVAASLENLVFVHQHAVKNLEKIVDKLDALAFGEIPTAR